MNTGILKSKVQEAISEIDDALNRGLFTVAREGYPIDYELRYILGELHRIDDELTERRVPPKAQRMFGIGRIILDTWWKYDKEPLAEKLLFISYAYLRKLP